jgi:hypothetical protein
VGNHLTAEKVFFVTLQMKELNTNPYKSPHTITVERKRIAPQQVWRVMLRTLLYSQLAVSIATGLIARGVLPSAMAFSEPLNSLVTIACMTAVPGYPILVIIVLTHYAIPIWKKVVFGAIEAALTIAYLIALYPAVS